MRPESNWECNVCEACGVCSGTLKECDTYHEFYGMEETLAVKVQFADGPAVIPTAITQHDIMNKGIINRLTGRIINVIEGDVMAQLTIEISRDNYISSIMPIEKYLESGKNKGDLVTAVFKAVNVLIMR
jgi:molybdopterin-binding protein